MSAEPEEIPKSELLENEDQTSKTSFLKSAPLELPPCDVCGGKASGIHYGVNSCEACKGFFRRYLARKDPYVCSKNNECVITDRPRGNCSACRMNKCLELGMSKEAVRQGRYTLEERTKTINAVRVLQGKDVDNMDFKFTPDSNQIKTEIPDDYHMTEDIKAALDLQALSIQSQTVSSSNSASGSTPSELNSTTSVSPSVFSMTSEERKNENDDEKDSKLQVILTCLTEAYDQFQYPSRKITPEEMQAKFNEASERYAATKQLIGSLNHLKPEEFNEVFEATGLDVDGRQNWMLKHKQVWEEIVTQYVNFAKAIPGFKSLNVTDQATLLKLARFEFFMLVEHNCIDPGKEVMVVHTGEAVHLEEMCYYAPKEMVKNWFDFTKRIRDLSFTKEELILVLAVCLLFRDRAKLEHPDEVEALQLIIVGHLRHMLKHRYGDKEFIVFTKIMDLFISFREINNQFLTAYKEMCSDKMVKQTMPEMMEFLFDE